MWEAFVVGLLALTVGSGLVSFLRFMVELDYSEIGQ